MTSHTLTASYLGFILVICNKKIHYYNSDGVCLAAVKFPFSTPQFLANSVNGFIYHYKDSLQHIVSMSPATPKVISNLNMPQYLESRGASLKITYNDRESRFDFCDYVSKSIAYEILPHDYKKRTYLAFAKEFSIFLLSAKKESDYYELQVKEYSRNNSENFQLVSVTRINSYTNLKCINKKALHLHDNRFLIGSSLLKGKEVVLDFNTFKLSTIESPIMIDICYSDENSHYFIDQNRIFYIKRSSVPEDKKEYDCENIRFISQITNKSKSQFIVGNDHGVYISESFTDILNDSVNFKTCRWLSSSVLSIPIDATVSNLFNPIVNDSISFLNFRSTTVNVDDILHTYIENLSSDKHSVMKVYSSSAVTLIYNDGVFILEYRDNGVSKEVLITIDDFMAQRDISLVDTLDDNPSYLQLIEYNGCTHNGIARIFNSKHKRLNTYYAPEFGDNNNFDEYSDSAWMYFNM